MTGMRLRTFLTCRGRFLGCWTAGQTLWYLASLDWGSTIFVQLCHMFIEFIFLSYDLGVSKLGLEQRASKPVVTLNAPNGETLQRNSTQHNFCSFVESIVEPGCRQKIGRTLGDSSCASLYHRGRPRSGSGPAWEPPPLGDWRAVGTRGISPPPPQKKKKTNTCPYRRLFGTPVMARILRNWKRGCPRHDVLSSGIFFYWATFFPYSILQRLNTFGYREKLAWSLFVPRLARGASWV